MRAAADTIDVSLFKKRDGRQLIEAPDPHSLRSIHPIDPLGRRIQLIRRTDECSTQTTAGKNERGFVAASIKSASRTRHAPRV
jgi:hypothetical protein